MKICLLGDTHIGLRNDSLIFNELANKFYTDCLFPYLKDNKIDTIFQFGDLFDRRKYINFNTLASAKSYFFNPMIENNITFHTLLGNHDIFFRNTVDVNSTSLLLGEYKNIHVYKEATTLDFDGLVVDIIPWICEENEKQIMKMISDSKSPFCFAHLELAGFEMDRGHITNEGMDSNIFKGYEQVISGHFHHKSSSGNIMYLGVPFEMCWNDWNDPKGFHILDTDTREIEFIKNPHNIYVKIPYNDDNLFFDDIQNHDFTIYKDKYVRILIEKRTNDFLLESLIESISKENPVDVSIVENMTDVAISNTEDSVDQADDTITIIEKTVDSLDINIEKTKLKTMMRNIYNEAQVTEW